ncbi:MAG TPA: DHH family phosphoesterase [Planctomycetota bacterium]|nr:DHH family phosphoesterase [Planctomycetota bacterium]
MNPQAAAARARVAERLRAAKRVVLTTHVTPDGDGLGSAVALARALVAMGKRAQVINCSTAPKELRFLYRRNEFEVYARERHDAEVLAADAVVATDIGGAQRMGKMEPVVRAARGARIVIDHHVYENDCFDVPYIVIGASSTAELVYDLLLEMEAPVTADVAEPLYVGLVADTGSFSYDAVTPRAHHFAARLLEAGVDPHAVWKKLTCNKPLLKVHVLGRLLASLTPECDGRLVWCKADLAFLRETGVEPRDAFEIVNHLLHVQGVEAGAFFLQLASDKTKVSVRSAGRLDVHGLAASYGGGGHRFAAGCTVDHVPFGEAVRQVLGALADDIRALDARTSPSAEDGG